MHPKFAPRTCTALALLAFFILQANVCGRRTECEGPFYSFQNTVSVTPGTDTVRVGDTLLLDVAVPVTQATTMGQNVTYAGAVNWSLELNAYRLNTNGIGFSSTANALQWIIRKGAVLATTASYRFVRASEENGVYRVTVQLIPTAVGTFMIEARDVVSVVRANDRSCTRATYQLSYAGNTHLNLYQTYYTGLPQPTGHFYFFAVKP